MHMTRTSQLGALSGAALASLTLQPLLLDQQHLGAHPWAWQQPVSRQHCTDTYGFSCCIRLTKRPYAQALAWIGHGLNKADTAHGTTSGAQAHNSKLAQAVGPLMTHWFGLCRLVAQRGETKACTQPAGTTSAEQQVWISTSCTACPRALKARPHDAV